MRVRMLHYLRVGLRITITQSHTHTMQQTRMHKAVTLRVEAKKLLSRRRQSEYYVNQKNCARIADVLDLDKITEP